MTQQSRLEEEIKDLARQYPVTDGIAHKRRVLRLMKMRDFYDSKVPEAPEKQAYMFLGFVKALNVSIGFMGNYRRLTKHLARLARELEEKQ